MNPLIFIIIIVGLLIFVLPRHLVFIPFIIGVCYVSAGIIPVIFGFHFPPIRIFILIGWSRLIARGEIRGLKLNSIDKAVIWWLVICLIANTLLWQTSEDLVYRLGQTYNAAGLYFLFRILIRDISEIEKIFKISAIIIFPLALMILYESFSGKNIFTIFGGIKELGWMRGGYLRAQGPFEYSGTAGCFAAIIMPFYAALWFCDKAKFNAFIGFFAATIIIVSCHSSGPLMAYCAGIIGLIMWLFHKRMRLIQYGILFTLISLHILMKAPVWFLIGRMGEIVGGDAYHRSAIIDAAIKHFDEWWLLGAKDTSTWMAYSFSAGGTDKGHADITNQFILEGVYGGFFSMLLFITVIILCFRQIGISLQLNENKPFSVRIILWSLGVSLLVNVVAFFSVSYFDQIIVIWYMLLAMISSTCIQKQNNSDSTIGKEVGCLE